MSEIPERLPMPNATSEDMAEYANKCENVGRHNALVDVLEKIEGNLDEELSISVLAGIIREWL